MRRAKRQRVDDVAIKELHVPDPALIKTLVQATLISLGAHDIDVHAQLLKLRAAPPAVGVGVFISDLPVRLFHAHAIRSVDCGESTRSFESAEALAVFCVEVMTRIIAEQPEAFQSIVGIALPDADDVAHGVHSDRILVRTRQFARVTPQSTPLEARLSILHRDDAVLVVDKPANMPSVDGTTTNDATVQSLVRQHYPDARIVHRLDQETSGILIVALTRTAAQHLNRQFRERSICKTYVARVLGHVDGDSGEIQLRMGPSATERLIQIVTEDGPLSHTTWRVLERSTDPATTLVELHPITGRTHQLRVHMLSIGHPILGDSLYATDRVQALAPRLLLHAQELTFTHPVTSAPTTIQCSSPFS